MGRGGPEGRDKTLFPQRLNQLLRPKAAAFSLTFHTLIFLIVHLSRGVGGVFFHADFFKAL